MVPKEPLATNPRIWGEERAEHAMEMDLGGSGWGPAWGKERGTEHPEPTLGTHGDLEDPTETPAGLMGTQYGAQGHGGQGHRDPKEAAVAFDRMHRTPAGSRWDATLRWRAEEPR